jgi:hypothetical protein
MGLQAGLWTEFRVSVYTKQTYLRHFNLNVIKHNILPIPLSTMIFKAPWATNLAQNFLSIDFKAVKSSFSFTLTLTKIIYCSSAGAMVV